MKYKSSLTKQIILTIIILFLFWIVNFLAIVSSNGVGDATAFSVIMVIFSIAFILAFVKGIYITIEDSDVKYTHMFLLRKTMRIEKIKKIQKGLVSGIYNSIVLISDGNSVPKEIKITTLTFKNNTLKQFVADLKNRNPQIEVDQSINEFLGE